MEWTAKSTVTKIMDGHAYQDDMEIEIGMPTPLVFRNITAWDSTVDTMVSISMSNMGNFSQSNPYWVDANTMVYSGTSLEQGVVVTDRTVVQYMEDKFHFKTDRSIAGGDFFTYLKGEYHRAEKADAVAASSIKAAMMPSPPQLKVFEGMAGNWMIAGKMSPEPGAPHIEVKGKETIEMILGGQVVFSDLIGEPSAELPITYKGQYYQFWDPAKKRISGFWISNMGEFVPDQSYVMEDGTIVTLHAGVNKGAPMAQRSMTAPDGKGGYSLTNWTLMGQSDPQQTFIGYLKRAQL